MGEGLTGAAAGTRTRRRGPHLQDLPLLALVHLAGQAAVRQRVLDDVLVGLGTGLLVELRSCGDSHGAVTACPGQQPAPRGRRAGRRVLGRRPLCPHRQAPLRTPLP